MTTLFDSSLITVQGPSDLVIRPLRSDDYDNGFSDILLPLAPTQEPLEANTFSRIFTEMTRHPYYTIVITEQSKIIASATLLLEVKFLRNGRTAGHIEDVVVRPSHQGRKLGKLLIDTLTALAKTLDCYKVILDCNDTNVAFYETCGYERVGAEMKVYL